MALTSAGHERCDALVAAVDRALLEDTGRSGSEIAAEVWDAGMPGTYRELERHGLAHFTYRVADTLPPGPPPAGREQLVDDGWVCIAPIVDEDFLPRSAAGISSSNLTEAGRMDDLQGGAPYDAGRLAEAIGRPVHVPQDGDSRQAASSWAEVCARLGRPLDDAPGASTGRAAGSAAGHRREPMACGVVG